jgi:predicted nuclease with TOPRIM domain
MNENLTTIIITAISVIFGAGGWKFYEFLIRNKREKQKEDYSEQTIYRDDLISRVEKLERDKDNCTESLMDMKVSVASLSVKVEFLEKENERLKIRLSR